MALSPSERPTMRLASRLAKCLRSKPLHPASSNSSQNGSPVVQPGQMLQQEMAKLPPSDRPLAVQHLEQVARSRADLVLMREIKAYKALPSIPPPPNG